MCWIILIVVVLDRLLIWGCGDGWDNLTDAANGYLLVTLVAGVIGSIGFYLGSIH